MQNNAYSQTALFVKITSHLIGLWLNVLGHVNLVANQKPATGRPAQRISENKLELLLICFVTDQKTAAIYTSK